MANQINVAAAVVVILAVIKSGESLRCWSCSSDMDVNCRDYFNTTYFTFGRSSYPSQYETGIRQSTGPYLQQCPEGGNVYLYDQKAVCVKKKQTYLGSSQQITLRQCATVPRNTRTGTCSHETTGASISVDFCEYCDYDGCNGASSLQKGVMALLLPAVLVFFMRK